MKITIVIRLIILMNLLMILVESMNHCFRIKWSHERLKGYRYELMKKKLNCFPLITLTDRTHFPR